MCHHYRVPKAIPEHFVAEFSLRTNQRAIVGELAAALPDSGAWPLKSVPAIRIGEDGELNAFAAEWGLLPRWWKPSDKQPKRSAFQRKTINARSETATEKPTFRDAWQKRRCVLPLVEFFERGHYFGTGEPIAFAGLWEAWRGDSGDVLTATLLTTEPNAEVQSVGHRRMPVLLATPDARRDWLLSAETDETLRPFPDGQLNVRGT